MDVGGLVCDLKVPDAGVALEGGGGRGQHQGPPLSSLPPYPPPNPPPLATDVDHVGIRVIEGQQSSVARVQLLQGHGLPEVSLARGVRDSWARSEPASSPHHPSPASRLAPTSPTHQPALPLTLSPSSHTCPTGLAGAPPLHGPIFPCRFQAFR